LLKVAVEVVIHHRPLVMLVDLVVAQDLMIVVQVEKEVAKLVLRMAQLLLPKEILVDLLQLVHLLTLVEVVEAPVVLV
tara:strand:- start:328 stop:561 length:234 start_codon:yes stop_codon:yes gene_type:complete